MRISRKFSCAFATIAALACSINVSAKPKEKEKDSEGKFIARSEMVLIPTVVTDKSGQHITGLKREDFRVLENGIEQKIATFDEVTSNTHRVSPPANVGEFSNSLAGEPPDLSITMIVLDQLNTPYADQAYARKQMLKYLMQSLDSREPTSLYTLTRSGIHLIHSFTTDPSILVAALHKVNVDTSHIVDTDEEVEELTGSATPEGTGGPGTYETPLAGKSSGSSGGGSFNLKATEMSGQIEAEIEAQEFQAFIEDEELNAQAEEQRMAILLTLQALQQVAQSVAGLPGRKSLIWAGGGFPFDVINGSMRLAAGSVSTMTPIASDPYADVQPMYERTWEMLDDAQIALYPVDVEGLQTFEPGASLGVPGKKYTENGVWREMDTQTTLETFASMTGGHAYYNANDLANSFHDAVNDSSQYYMLGYYRAPSKTTAGWQRLTVKVDRKHTEVRARNGFFVTNASIDSASSEKKDILLALKAPMDYTSLTLVARWYQMAPSKEPGKVHVTYQLRLAPGAVEIDGGDNNHFVLDIVALAETVGGKPAGEPRTNRLDTHLSAAKLPVARRNGIGFLDALDLAPGEYTVHFVVRDELSGRIGSVEAPLTVK